MTLWKRLKNLWYLSGLSWNQSAQVPVHSMSSIFPRKQMATIVEDTPEVLLDNIDLT